MPESSVLPTAIYQLRVVLCGVSPLVWRRLLVLKETSLAELHGILQTAFDWSANIYTASLSMAGPMGFRIWAALFSGKMPDGYRFSVFVCIVASVSVMNTTSQPIGSWTFGWSGLCPLIRTAFFRHASAETERRRRKTALEPWTISSDWTGTEATCPSMS